MKPRSSRRLLLLILLLLVLVGAPVLVTQNWEGHPPPAPAPEPDQAVGVYSRLADEAGLPDPFPSTEAEEQGPPTSTSTGSGEPRSFEPAVLEEVLEELKPADHPVGYFPELSGWIRDIDTGKPVAGARVLYGPFPGWWGDAADQGGVFSFSIHSTGIDPKHPFGLKIIAPGYEILELTPGQEKLLVELRPLGRPLLPGRIRGRAEDAQGRPIAGVVGVILGDGTANRHHLKVLADVHGGFLLAGVEPGVWAITLAKGDAVKVYVPEDAEVQVSLRSGVAREALTPFSEEEAAALARLRKLVILTQASLEGLEAARSSTSQVDRMREQLQALLLKTQTLESAEREVASRRAVRIEGIPAENGTRLVAEFYGRASTERWWAVVKNGSASYPALIPGKWTFLLNSAGESIRAELEVPEQADGTRLRFPD